MGEQQLETCTSFSLEGGKEVPRHGLGVIPFLFAGVRKLSLLAKGGGYPSRYPSCGCRTINRTNSGVGCWFLLEPRRLRLEVHKKQKPKTAPVCSVFTTMETDISMTAVLLTSTSKRSSVVSTEPTRMYAPAKSKSSSFQPQTQNAISLGRRETRGTRATDFDGVAGSFTGAALFLTEPADSFIEAADSLTSARRADPGRILEETKTFRIRVSSEAELSTEDLPSAGEIFKLSGPPSSCQNCPASSEPSCQVPSKVPRAPASLSVDKALPGFQGNARESLSTSSSSATPSC